MKPKLARCRVPCGAKRLYGRSTCRSAAANRTTIRRASGATHTLPLACRASARRQAPQPPSGGTNHHHSPVGRQPDERRQSQRAQLRHNIAQPDGFCKREARGVDLGPRPERRAPQGASRQSEIAPHLGKKTKKNGERDGTRTRNIHRDRVAL